MGDKLLDWAVKVMLFGFTGFLMVACAASGVGCALDLNPCPYIERAR